MLIRIVFFGCLLLLPVATATAHPSLNEDQARQLASHFCQRIGIPVTASGIAQCPSPQDTHWQVRWRIVFQNQATVEVVDASGTISYYRNDALFERLDRDKRPAGVAISETDAIRRASSALVATGETKEMAFQQARLMRFTAPPTAAGHVWIVSWVRQFQNIPYRGEGTNVLLDAETGAVKSLSKTFISSPPQAAVFKVSRAKAGDIAIKQIANAGIQATPVSIQAQVVQPNTFWFPGGREVESVPIAWVAWVCHFKIEGWEYEVWVDTETGRVIGGSVSSHLGMAQNPNSMLSNMPKTVDETRQILEAADEIRVFIRSSTAGKAWEDKPLVTLSERSNAKMFHVLKEKTNFPSERGRLLLAADTKLVIVRKGTSHEVGYSLRSGHLLVAPDQWGMVNDKFKDWLLKEIPTSKKR